MAADAPTLTFTDADAFDQWLAAQPAGSAGVWLKLAKKASGVPSVDYSQALDVALCHGWIDGPKAGVDEVYWLQKFTPRRARSRWSKINRNRVASLIEQGRMRPAGLAEIERAQADGRWEAAYDSMTTAEVPDDLAQALAANPDAARFFETVDRQNRYAVLYRIQEAKRPETRARRVAQYVAMLAEGRKIYP
ncbi:YdeI/OmpD-associated family protein [Catellatospora sichuanensis]|uniref:YdeI/OmpD-associated family protein n=1 Tax=Catellatospora sichuanensis TaxID=1969805 RepID=UPI001182D919|nr:YdeI/OmpD-associated family protein [Catellatospora sichuanensis]